jgi:hypothetical protein
MKGGVAVADKTRSDGNSLANEDKNGLEGKCARLPARVPKENLTLPRITGRWAGLCPETKKFSKTRPRRLGRR